MKRMKAMTPGLVAALMMVQAAAAAESGTNFFATSRIQSYTNGHNELEVQVDTPGKGRVIRWHEDGTTNSIHEFSNYAYNGTLRTWDAQGHLTSLSCWKNGERHGTSTYWRADGRKLAEQDWKEGKLLAKHWWDDAGKKHEGDPPIE